jgi:hypothetical protein
MYKINCDLENELILGCASAAQPHKTITLLSLSVVVILSKSVLHFLKICTIFVASVHIFSRYDGDII